ncbi:hypothetical protein [Nocardia sp. CDC160]|uniref:hypothetical protein n=1 Tax=Nocardia sp. CDC160 TaxID=3112166 RepID=UPI002DBFA546|nr:hypothetical protein [Nocardia sp. CDC160]MEC3918190.1 hypothetical protein [Nocardia sp. CDC160]
MRTVAAVGLTAAIVTGTSGFAAADPTPAQAPAPAVALFTLTAMPAGWQTRTDLHPSLLIQSDGHATKRADNAAQPVEGTVPADVIGAAAAEVKALAAVDMGTPGQGDGGTSIIDYMPQAPDQDVHLIVYAPESSEGLTDEQKASRKRFDDVFQRLLNAFVPA